MSANEKKCPKCVERPGRERYPHPEGFAVTLWRPCSACQPDPSANEKDLEAVVAELRTLLGREFDYYQQELAGHAARLIFEARRETQAALARVRDEMELGDTSNFYGRMAAREWARIEPRIAELAQRLVDEQRGRKQDREFMEGVCGQWKFENEKLEAERDAAVRAHQESLQTVAVLRESLRVAEARAERFKAEMYRVDEVQTAKLLVATDRVATLEGELTTWKEDHAEAMRLAWENGERRDAALARVKEYEKALDTHGPSERTTALDAEMPPAEMLRTLTLVRTLLGQYMADCGRYLERVKELEADNAVKARANATLAARLAGMEAAGAANAHVVAVVRAHLRGIRRLEKEDTWPYGQEGHADMVADLRVALAEGSEGGK